MPSRLSHQVQRLIQRGVGGAARSLRDILDGRAGLGGGASSRARRAAERPEPPRAPIVSDLSRALLESPRYRTVGDEAAFRARILAIYCYADEAEEAVQHFAGTYDSNVAAVVLHEEFGAAQVSGIGDVEVLHVDGLKVRPELTLVVYGRHVDRKLVRLAIEGVRTAIFAKDPGYHPTIRWDPQFFEKNRQALSTFFAQLCDDESRLVLASIVRMRTSGDYGYIRLAEFAEYDHPIVGPAPGDVVFDLGMETAHTSLWFSDRVGEGGSVVGFEASPDHWALIEDALERAGRTNIRMVKMGVWKEKSELEFITGMGGASRVSRGKDPRATIRVPVIDIDSFVAEEKLDRVNLLSFDIEGAEPEALMGAKRTIQKHRPKLQVSVYHRLDHLYTIPALITSFGVPYRFYLGHHSAQGLETDLYAEPV